MVLKTQYSNDNSLYEIGIDESGRGPLFGRVYAAAVILPKDDTFDFSKIKDSKKFSSKKKIKEVENYIKNNSLYWSVQYEDEKVIDQINILQATQKTMHKCIDDILLQMNNNFNTMLLVDGNYFIPYKSIPSVCIESGDNIYANIAAASILAKVARDDYIHELCNDYPLLKEKYSIDTNKGYGSSKHINAIKEHGITEWHRKSFGICKNYKSQQ
jgi:ribonuclease HII